VALSACALLFQRPLLLLLSPGLLLRFCPLLLAGSSSLSTSPL
jgi:hypothetical protein